MSDTIIKVEGLSKRYVIDHQRSNPDGLRHQVEDLLRAPWRWAQRLSQSSAISKAKRSTKEEFWALKDISFEIKQGEVVGVIGRNGAGKSTLLKILSRIVEPTEGRVTLKGRVASLLEVGTGFHQELTGRENIFLNGAILGMTRGEIKRKFDEIVAFSEIERFLDTPVKRYSSGMYVRLAFAVAAHLEPEILVVDEVLAVGDADFQKKCLGKMGEVARGGRTVLFVSHNLAAIRTLCDRGIVLTAGRKSFDGTALQAAEIYSSRGELSVGMKWHRPPDLPTAAFSFQEISASLLGKQPSLKLDCAVKLRCSQSCLDCFVAIDILGTSGSPILQAIPDDKPFIKGNAGTYSLQLQVELPALVPGIYTANFWIGPSYSTTFDSVREALTFEITEGPIPNRSVPHSGDHGFMVAPSRCVRLSRVEDQILTT